MNSIPFCGGRCRDGIVRAAGREHEAKKTFPQAPGFAEGSRIPYHQYSIANQGTRVVADVSQKHAVIRPSQLFRFLNQKATWVEGTVEGLMPPSASTSTGGGAAAGGSSNNAGGGNGSGKGGGQGSWRKVGGAWRRVGGWGKSGGGRGNGSDSSEGVFKEEKPAGEGKLTEADMDNPVIEVDHER